ncbi:hypothetical protein D2T29_09740 [Sinirhodobacter populi]|uniref:Uncharacterized protein n=1 Tax=Paenirhodobacter populi TaxID=2306993 RepID=A0A443KGA4_9RHOB|nr:hypothetical protein [Sinirhodobacter populi]RWR31780.1 hypothetical protein D2T29_09740 [Sinirhodobacter populi]
MRYLRWLGLAILVASLPLSLFLPDWTSWENGPIEDAQTLVLLIGGIIALAYAARGQGRQKLIWLAVVPVWFAMCARELSWGAVFLPPMGMTGHGPQFSASQLWFKPYIKPILLALLILSVASFAKGGGFGIFARLFSHRLFPVRDIVAFVVAMLASAAAEGHMGLSLGSWGEAQVIEEMAELAAYVFLLSAQARVHAAIPAVDRLRAAERNLSRA